MVDYGSPQPPAGFAPPRPPALPQGRALQGARPPDLAPLRRPAAGVAAHGPRDHLWEVLHHEQRPVREQSQSPPERGGGPGGGAWDRESRSAPGRAGEAPEAFAAAAADIAGGYQAKIPGGYGRPLPPLGWQAPGVAPGAPVPVVAGAGEAAIDWRHELKAGLRPRILGVEASGGAEALEKVERRLETAQAEQRADVSRRFSAFEQADRRFKEWVQREHEQLHNHLQQVKAATMDGQQQQQRQTASLLSQAQKSEMRVQELEAAVGQASARAEGVAQALQAQGGAAQGAGGPGMSQAAYESLRADLDREVAARASLSEEATQKIKELHGLFGELSGRQESEAYNRQQQIQDQTMNRQARLAAIEPGLDSMRTELDALREQLRRTGDQCSQRCQEVESACTHRVAGVQEAALAAARELWEEHQGVLMECKTSMASLQQILETKDKIAAQLQTVQQAQREDDKHEVLTRLSQGHEALFGRVMAIESALGSEQEVRLSEQQKTDVHVGRMGAALEKAQESWLQDSERLSNEVREAKRQTEKAIDTEARTLERRMAEGMDSAQRRLEDLEGRASAMKASLSAAEERAIELDQAMQAELKDAEARLKRQLADLQTIQAGKVSQVDFDLRAWMRAGLAEQAERSREELSRVEEAAAAERGGLRTLSEEAKREMEERVLKVREDMERRLASAEEASVRRAVQAAEACSTLRIDLTEFNREVRSYTDRAVQDARAINESDLATIREDVARGALKGDRADADLAKDIMALEDRLSAAITALDAKAAVQLASEIRLEHERLRDEVNRMAAEERNARLKAEAERHEALQKRLAAHEELAKTRSDELRLKQEDALRTHQQEVAAQILQEHQDTERHLEELDRTQSATAANAKAEFARIDAECERLRGDLDKATGDKLKALEEQLNSELAGFGSKLAVSLATASTELQHGLTSAEAKLGEAVTAAAQSRAQLRVDMEAGFARLRGSITTIEAAGAASKAEIKATIESTAAEQEAKVEAQVSGLQGQCYSLGTRAAQLEERANVVDTKLEAQGEEISAALNEARTEAEAGIREAREAVQADAAEMAEKVRQVRDEMAGLEEEMLKRVKDIEEKLESEKVQEDAMIGGIHRQLGELSSKLEDDRTALQEALADARRELEAASAEAQKASEAAAVALEEKLQAGMAEAELARGDLGKRLDGLDENLRKEEGQAREAEADLRKGLEGVEAALEERLREVEEKRAASADEAKEELTGKLETLRSEQEAQVRAEEARAKEAEAELAQRLEGQAEASETARAAAQASMDEKLQQLGAEQQRQVEEMQVRQEKSLADLGDRLEEHGKAQESAQETAQNSLQELIQELGQTQQKQADEGLESIRTQLEAEEKRALAAEEALGMKIDAQEKALVESQEQVQSQLKAAEEAAGKVWTEIDQVRGAQADAVKTLREQMDTVMEEQEKAAVQQKVASQAVGDDLKAEVERLKAKQEEEHAALQQKLEATEVGQQQAAAERGQEQKTEVEELQKRLSAVEERGGDLGKEAQALRELQEQHRSEQLKINKDVQTRQDAVSDDIELLGQKLQEFSTKFDAEAAAEEEQTRGIAELTEHLDAVEKRIEEKASAEVVAQLQGRVEGGFDAILVQIESERWLKENVDKVADDVTNEFLRLLDDSSQKLTARVDKLEKGG